MRKKGFNIYELYGLWPSDIKGIDSLLELALNMRWSWNHSADELWQQLDPALWELTRNPWVVLQTVSHDRLERQMAFPAFRDKINELMNLKEIASSKAGWFQQNYSNSPLKCVAYFSMEYMLSEALPIYVGGLGNVSGDQLKSASDLGLPVAAVGLLYQQGYFHQEIDQYDNQQALFPYNDPGQLPISPLRLPNGEWLRVKVAFPGFPIWLRTWQVQVGRVKLYLLDSNDAANLPVYRGITNELYGGGPEVRIQQELILGIGGWKLLKAIGIRPEVCHLNEGHSGFLVLERANDFMKETGSTFETALTVTRAGNLFTTHTAVAAGFDHFSPLLMEQFLSAYAKEELGIGMNELMALGRQNPYDTSESFNTAYLAIRGSGFVNGVSRLHAEVSRRIFRNLFPRWPEGEIPVGYVTNGVHMPSWDSEFADQVWTEASGKDRWRGEQETLEQDISALSDEKLWELRSFSRNQLVNFTRKRFERQSRISGQSAAVVEAAKVTLNPDTLTLGFARRFVAYKRPNLLLQDHERFIRILTNPHYPVQLIIAGKAPPSDEEGKEMIRQWIQFIREHQLYSHVVFLTDYDMFLTENLVQGADVWINTPKRPWEASGTSGMKVLVNGGINISELDGWWAEAYTPEVGWALGDGKEHGDDSGMDDIEAAELYDLLEQQVVPEFYTRNEKGIPANWIKRMRNSMGKLTPRFSANRTVREYTEKYYLPAAAAYTKRAAGNGAAAMRIVEIQKELQNKWEGIRFTDFTSKKLDRGYLFSVHIHLNTILPDNVLIEVYANPAGNQGAERIRMDGHPVYTKPGEFIYHAEVTTSRVANDYTVRIIPHYEDIAVPIENSLICWQR